MSPPHLRGSRYWRSGPLSRLLGARVHMVGTMRSGIGIFGRSDDM